MREALLGKLLLLLANAPPKELAGIYRFARRLGAAGPQQGAPGSQPKQVPAEGASEAAAQDGPAYVFRRVGRHWEAVFCGGRTFRLRHTLGARYLDYLLHEPNEPIRAFDLELKAQAEKGEARVRDSFQPEADPQAMREYRQTLRRLKAARADAQTTGDREKVEGLDSEIEALESALKGRGAADTGERARDNVRKALAVVMEQLRQGGPEEKAFAEHLRNHLSIGHECLYSQPHGRIWA